MNDSTNMTRAANESTVPERGGVDRCAGTRRSRSDATADVTASGNVTPIRKRSRLRRAAPALVVAVVLAPVAAAAIAFAPQNEAAAAEPAQATTQPNPAARTVASTASAGAHALAAPERVMRPAPVRAARRPSATAPLAPAPEQKTFVWPKVRNAHSYEIAFFRGARQIFSRTTTAPRLTLPARWTYRGTHQSLTGGAYRWYVWSIGRDGTRSPRAIISSSLVVSD
jgi:hypothetical protein